VQARRRGRGIGRLQIGRSAPAAHVWRTLSPGAAPHPGTWAGQRLPSAQNSTRSVSRVSNARRRPRATGFPIRRRGGRGRRPGCVRGLYEFRRRLSGLNRGRRYQRRRERQHRSSHRQLVHPLFLRRRQHLYNPRPDDRIRQHSRRRLLLRPDRAIYPQHRPFHLADAVQHGLQWQEPPPPSCSEPRKRSQQQLHIVDILGPDLGRPWHCHDRSRRQGRHSQPRLPQHVRRDELPLRQRRQLVGRPDRRAHLSLRHFRRGHDQFPLHQLVEWRRRLRESRYAKHGRRGLLGRQ
jgi:hypothetical protein